MTGFRVYAATLALLLLDVPTVHAPRVTVIVGVTVIDGTGAAPQPGMVVVVRGDRIEAVRRAKDYRPPRDAHVLDAQGRFLVPGFVDMHAHVSVGPVEIDSVTKTMRSLPDTTVASRSLRALLQFGITTIRDPAGPAALEVAVRDSVERGQLFGPRVFVAGEAIDQTVAPGLVTTARTPEEVRAAVREQVARGVDYIKLYAGLTPPLVRAGIEEAHAQGKKAIGHLFLTSWTDAVEMGIDGLLHAVPSSPLLLPPARRAAYMQGIHDTRFMFQWFEHVDLAGPEIDTLVRSMVAHRVEHDATLVTFEAMAWGDSARITSNPNLALAPPSMLANWRNGFTLTMGWKPAEFDSARAVWPRILQFEKLLYDRGVLLTAGTDANNPWTVPGPSFHRELELLASAGIPPLQVIRIATLNGAQALGIADSAGTIAPGKRADLVLLTKDPSKNISNTRAIDWVMKGGAFVQEP